MALSVGIDLGSSSIKVIAGRAKGPVFEVTRAFSLPVGGGDDSESSVLNTVAGLKPELGKAAGARYSVSGRELIIRYTKVPQVPLWRLRLLMDFEIREMAEQAGDALASDYNVVNAQAEGGGEETLLVAVVKEPFLLARHDALRQAIGEPRAAMPSSLALFDAYLQAGELHEGEYVFLVDIGDQNIEMALERDGDLIFARNIAGGGHQLTAAVAQSLRMSEADAQATKESLGNVTPRHLAKYGSGREEQVANALAGPMGQLSSMIQSSLAFAKAQSGIKELNLGRMLLTGGTANLQGLTEALAGTFKCKVERFEPESGIDLSSLPDDERSAFEADPGSFAIALGLAVADTKADAFVVDLVPSDVKKKRHFKTRTLWVIAAAIMAVLVLGLRYMSLSSEAASAQKAAGLAQVAAGRTRRTMAEYSELQKTMSSTVEKLQALDALTRPAFTVARGLRLVQENAPDTIWVEDLKFQSQVVPVDPKDASKGRTLNELVSISGQVMSKDTTSRASLEELSRTIERVGDGASATLRWVGDGRGGSTDTRFTMDLKIIGSKKPDGPSGEQL
ncbi:MAG TPA: pilus assembly protein PilM [Planctomycetota bacterium]|nr:pilus assembly protein PilM [Planctomycetota bacterium]